MPAGTELRGKAPSAGVSADADEGAGGSGVESGCAAEVDVAAGGPSCVLLGGLRAEVCVLWVAGVEAGWRRRAVVERRRGERGVLSVVRRWRQRGQIIVGEAGGLGLGLVVVMGVPWVYLWVLALDWIGDCGQLERFPSILTKGARVEDVISTKTIALELIGENI